VVLKAGSYAAERYEPRQIREEAAVNRSPGCRRATWLELAGSSKLLGRVEGRCTTSRLRLFINLTPFIPLSLKERGRRRKRG